MTERSVGRPWTLEEDVALKRGVEMYGECDHWKAVATYVPGRTNKACRKRWLHSLSPRVKKTAWTQQEDQLLTSLYNQYGPKWSAIARQIPGRTDDACSKRYRESLDPSLRRDEWTHEEDCRLAATIDQMGVKWGQVGQTLQRSGLSCRNRWRYLKRKNFDPRSQPSDYAHSSHPSSQSAPEVYHSSGPLQYHDPAASYRSQAPVDSPCTETNSIDSSPYSSEVGLPFGFEPSHFPEMMMNSAQDIDLDNLMVDFQDWQDPYFLDPADACLALATSFQALEKPGQPSCPSSSHSLFGSIASLPFPDPYSIEALSLLDSPGSSLGPPLTPELYFSPTLPDNTPLQDEFTSSISVPAQPFDSLFQEPQQLSTNDVSIPLLPFSSETSRSASPEDCSTSQVEPSSQNVTLVSEPLGPSDPEPPTVGAPARPTLVVRTVPRQRTKRKKQGIEPSRLSSILPATSDPSIRPYACGHQECWPSDAPEGKVCFATSKELSEHNKQEHVRDYSTRPFKCGLAGCGKSWKNINGLQYHLQISPAHFQNAVSSSLSSVPEQGTDDEAAATDERMYRCSVSGCRKVYRQLSGLKYHQSKGHPPEIPAQLEIVPPSIARRIADTSRKKGSLGAINDTSPAE